MIAERHTIRFDNGDTVPLNRLTDGNWACPICGMSLPHPPRAPIVEPTDVSEPALGDICGGCGVEFGVDEGCGPDAPKGYMRDQYARLRIRHLNLHRWAADQLQRVRTNLDLTKEQLEADRARLVAGGPADRWRGPLRGLQAEDRHAPGRSPLQADTRPIGTYPVKFANGELMEFVELRWGGRNPAYACPVCGKGQSTAPYTALRSVDDLSFSSFGDRCADCGIQYGIDDHCPDNWTVGAMRGLYDEYRVRWLDRTGWRADAIEQISKNLGIAESELQDLRARLISSGRLA